MLLDFLQSSETGALIILEDSVHYSGRCLLKSYIRAALKRDEVVHVLGFEVSEEETRGDLDGSCAERLLFHDGYKDPLGWRKSASFTAHQFNSQDLTRILRQTQQPKAPVLVIDSLSWLLRHHDPVAICRSLQELRRGGAVRTIVGLLHSDLHNTSTVDCVSHLATAVVTLAPTSQGPLAVAKTTKRTKSGKVTQDEELFSIQGDLTVTIHRTVSQAGKKQTEQESSEADPTANLTFNLRLSDTEREAKEKVSLPFVFSQEKKSALLHKGQRSGRILYVPDANDDFDQEDPDDDLDV
ncbi:elongator complex protein 5 [Denticeps clupeoides]|uniref:Elongator complex protein 5 n=1 Tax=Denticeps clupeoides TaxID=299321 RepID=A0AAY3ZUK4_9TELE|nr:elongator complex protein 5 [Denticeps clupeoides]